MPSQLQRARFIGQYLRAYHAQRMMSNLCRGRPYYAQEGYHKHADRLFDEVDRFRGLPGLYWFVAIFIQALF